MLTTIIVLILMLLVRQGLKSLCVHDRYSHEMPKWMRRVGIWRINGGHSQSIDFNWGYWSPRMGFCLETSPSYEENWFMIRATFLFGTICLILKWRPSDWDANMDVNEAEGHRCGFGINEDILYINKPGQAGIGYWKSWYLPFIHSIHVETKDVGEKHNTTLIDHDLTSVPVTYWETNSFFRYKWTPFKFKVRRLNYDYNGKEVGPGKGSWKGGTMSGTCPMQKKDQIMEVMLATFERHKNGK